MGRLRPVSDVIDVGTSQDAIYRYLETVYGIVSINREVDCFGQNTCPVRPSHSRVSLSLAGTKTTSRPLRHRNNGSTFADRSSRQRNSFPRRIPPEPVYGATQLSSHFANTCLVLLAFVSFKLRDMCWSVFILRYKSFILT